MSTSSNPVTSSTTATSTSSATGTANSTGPTSNSTTLQQKPRNYAVLLFPAFQALDVFGPLDALNVLSTTFPMNLYLIASSLAPVSTRPRSAVMNPAGSNFSESVVPTHTFATAPEDIDVLLVPGGLGVRAPDTAPVIAFIRERYPRVKYLITVCTGAALAVRSGVLQGRRATTNKLSWEYVVGLKPDVVNGTSVAGSAGSAGQDERGTGAASNTTAVASNTTTPGTQWIPHARWVQDGNIWTSAGVSAGIDTTLAFIASVYGSEDAERIATYLEYDWHRDWQWDPFSSAIKQV